MFLDCTIVCVDLYCKKIMKQSLPSKNFLYDWETQKLRNDFNS